MAIDSSSLIQALIDGGISPAASKLIANAIANAATPQYAKSRDIADATPVDQLRLIDGDTRKYLLTNLDYSSEAPYLKRLSDSPGQYAGGPADHPYKDSQPVAPVPPLSTTTVQAGSCVSVEQAVKDNSAVATVGLKFGTKSGQHMRLNQGTQAVDAVALNISSPQGFVTASVTENAEATDVELVVRQLSTVKVVQDDGITKDILGWASPTSTPSTIFSPWFQQNLMLNESAASVLATLGIPSTAPSYTVGTWTPTITGDGTASSITYSTADTTGRWVRIGNWVWVTGRIIVANVFAAGTGNTVIAGLPFGVAATNANLAVMPILYKSGWFQQGPTGAYFLPSSGRAQLVRDLNTTIGFIPISSVAAGTDCIFSGSYFTA